MVRSGCVVRSVAEAEGDDEMAEVPIAVQSAGTGERVNLHRRAVLCWGVAAAAASVGACRGTPPLRLLVDQRLHGAVGEGVSLFEMRTGQRVRAAYVSEGRLEVLMRTGAHDVVVAEAEQLDAHPVTSQFDGASRRSLGRDAAGAEFGCVLRKAAGDRAIARSLWLFLQDDEVRVLLEHAGVKRVAADAGAGQR